MQTVCAHCYIRLSHRQQRTACILCTRCEQNWAAGKPPVRGRKLPGPKDGIAVLPFLHQDNAN